MLRTFEKFTAVLSIVLVLSPDTDILYKGIWVSGPVKPVGFVPVGAVAFVPAVVTR